MPKLIYTEHALKDLLVIDKPVARRIVLKIKENSELSDPLNRAKALVGVLEGLYRYRVGNYRVIFSFERGAVLQILTVLRIKHRKEIYKR